MKIYYYIMFFIIGSCFGSYFGVLGLRIPREEKTFNSRSHCENCGHILKWYELIPIFSYFIQNGKCRYCHKKLSLFYPFLEISTGLLFAVSYYSYNFSYELLIALVIISLFMLVVVSDLTYLMIPDRFILTAGILIFIFKVLEKGIINGLIQLGYGLICFVGMYLIMLLGNKIFKKETLGGADIKLMFLVGLTLDPLLAIVVLFLSSITALPVSLYILFKKNDHVIPYGPFIIFALLVVNFTKLNIIEIFEKIISLF